jgi:putative addiction module CopG family antidote
MTIHLPEDLERFVHDQVRAGRYPSEEDMIRDALKRLRQAQNATSAPRPVTDPVLGAMREDAENARPDRSTIRRVILLRLGPPRPRAGDVLRAVLADVLREAPPRAADGPRWVSMAAGSAWRRYRASRSQGGSRISRSRSRWSERPHPAPCGAEALSRHARRWLFRPRRARRIVGMRRFLSGRGVRGAALSRVSPRRSTARRAGLALRSLGAPRALAWRPCRPAAQGASPTPARRSAPVGPRAGRPASGPGTRGPRSTRR